MKVLVVALLLGASALAVKDDCGSGVTESARKDCHPEPNSSEAECQKRGCIWCQSKSAGVPWCFHNPKSCDAGLLPSERQDCHPEHGVTEEPCRSRGCAWCPSDVTGVPWCFFREKGVSRQTAADGCHVAEDKRADCHLEDGATREACGAKGCLWCQNSKPGLGIPWCFFDSTGWSDPFPHDQRVNCAPEGTVSAATCKKRGCWLGPGDNDAPGAPVCYFPRSRGYKLKGPVETTPLGLKAVLEMQDPSLTLYGADFREALLEVEMQTDTRLRIKLSDAKAKRWEVPIPITSKTKATNPLYSVDIGGQNGGVFSIKVTRKDNSQTVFDTSIGGLVLSDQFLQVATHLASRNVFGFGETEHHSFKHPLDWTTYAMWARDLPPTWTVLKPLIQHWNYSHLEHP